MLMNFGGAFAHFAAQYVNLENMLSGMDPNEPLTSEYVELFIGERSSPIRNLRTWAEEVSLQSVVDQLDRIDAIAEKCKTLGQIEVAEARDAVKSLRERLQDELRRRHFLYVRDFRLYLSPLRKWAPTTERFQTIVPEIEEAGRCLALSRGTACVFHLMRVLECGLVELARYLQVSQADEPHNWGELINRVNAEPKVTHPQPESPVEF